MVGLALNSCQAQRLVYRVKWDNKTYLNLISLINICQLNHAMTPGPSLAQPAEISFANGKQNKTSYQEQSNFPRG